MHNKFRFKANAAHGTPESLYSLSRVEEERLPGDTGAEALQRMVGDNMTVHTDKDLTVYRNDKQFSELFFFWVYIGGKKNKTHTAVPE